MKKLLCLLLALVMVLTFAACDDNDRDRDRDDDEESEAVSTETPEEAYDLWFESITTIVSESKLKAAMPEEVWAAMEEEYDDPYETYQGNCEDRFENWESYYGENWKVTYEIVDEENLDEDELEEYAKELEETYGIDPDSVEEGVRLYLEISLSGDEDEEVVDDNAVILKINGVWYNADGF